MKRPPYFAIKDETSSKAVEFAWLLFALIIMLIPFAILKPYMGHFYNAVYILNFWLGFFWSEHIYPALRNRFIRIKSIQYFALILMASLILVAVFLWECLVRVYLELSNI